MRVATLITCIFSIIVVTPLFAQDEEEAHCSSCTKQTCGTNCTMELFIAFFPPPFVGETLEAFQIDSDKRLTIIQQLSHHELDINSIVDSKAAKMTPNPLNQPDRQEDVIKLFDEAVLQVFTQVMNDNGITDKDQIAKMLEQIQKRKADHFRTCMMIEVDTPK